MILLQADRFALPLIVLTIFLAQVRPIHGSLAIKEGRNFAVCARNYQKKIHD